ncbi:MAG: Fe-S cluster assembly protein SufD [Maricaulaceae bacterium]
MTPMPPKANIEQTEAEIALGVPLPHRRNEAWKWTDVRKAARVDQTGLTHQAIPHFEVPDGVTLTEGSSDDLKTDSPMVDLARTLGGSVWTFNVPDDAVISTPLVIGNLSRGHARILITLGKNAELSMTEHYLGEVGGFSNLDMTIELKAGAKLTRTIVHQDPADHLRVATTHITAWQDANITQHTLSFGGALSRIETRVAGMGADIKADIHGAYLLSGKRHADMTSYVDLASTGNVIRQTVKGVVADKARGVFQGKFHVRKPAQQTDAEMRHDALMLSDTSEIRAKPELEIYADDVACAHGNTLGALDESALFYMRQRGIPLAQARALLTEAFLAEAFDDMTDEGLQDSLMTQIRSWLEAHS